MCPCPTSIGYEANRQNYFPFFVLPVTITHIHGRVSLIALPPGLLEIYISERVPIPRYDYVRGSKASARSHGSKSWPVMQRPGHRSNGQKQRPCYGRAIVAIPDQYSLASVTPSRQFPGNGRAAVWASKNGQATDMQRPCDRSICRATAKLRSCHRSNASSTVIQRLCHQNNGQATVMQRSRHRSSAQETAMQRPRHRMIRSAKQRPINSHSTGFLPVTDPWVVHYWLLYGTSPYLYRGRCSSELGKTRTCLRYESKRFVYGVRENDSHRPG